MTIMTSDRTEWTAPELMAMEFPAPSTAGDLIRDGLCWPSCLLAQCDDDNCMCPCGGRYHGELLGAAVEGRRVMPTWWQDCGYSESLLDREIPTASSRRSPSTRDPELGKFRVQKMGGRYEGTWDIDIPFSFATPRPPRLSSVDQEQIAELGRVLLRMNRARITTVSTDLVCIYGCRTPYDAKAFLFIAIEIFVGNVDGWLNTMDRLGAY